MDWKCGLNLELIDTDFHYSILSEFRPRLVNHITGTFGCATKRLTEKGLLKAKRQHTNRLNHHYRMRELGQLELVGESVRYTLIVLATAL